MKIGILRALYLGDMLCMIPAVRSLRGFYPDAKIVLIGLPWQRRFIERFSQYFDEFISFPGWPDFPEQEYDPQKSLAFIQQMREEQFDLIFQMQGNGDSANRMCKLFCPKALYGLRRGSDNADERFFPISEDSDHEILRFLKLTDAIGAPRQGDHLEFPLMPAEIENARAIMGELSLSPGTYVCIHPGARDQKRRWDPEKFASVGDMVHSMGYRVVLTGSYDEQTVLHSVSSSMRSPHLNLVSLCGQIPLGELAFIIDQSALLFSNDTWVSHIAAALEIPSIIIFSGYADPDRWAPLRRDINKVIKYNESLPMETIAEALKDGLSIPVGC